MCVPKRIHLAERYSRWLLRSIFYYGRFLDVVNCYWDHRRSLVFPANKYYKNITSLFRIIIILLYWDVIPKLVFEFYYNPRSFMQIFTVLQVLSVAIFSMGLFWMKMRDEFKLIQLINRFIQINKTIVALMNKNITLCKKFVVLSTLKGFITFLGYINELPTLLDVETVRIHRWFSLVVGAYLWLGSMFVLDGCYMGFQIISLMYCNLGVHMRQMLSKMQNIEAGSLMGSSYTPYYRMKLLCDYADQLDAIGRIYSSLYRVTKEFVRIFQWNILYYIYYNFMVIFLLLNHSIWKYIQQGFIDFLQIFFIFVKIANLVLMIMVASNLVEKSETPNHLNLDVVCSDIDVRWDTSVSVFFVFDYILSIVKNFVVVFIGGKLYQSTESGKS